MENIATKLCAWVTANEDKIYNPFLSHPGKLYLVYNQCSTQYYIKGFDPLKDTLIEILHTILVGIVKYLQHSTHRLKEDLHPLSSVC